MKSRFLEIQQLERECTRCLNCQPAPCAKACPLSLSPREFIAKAKLHHYSSAIETIYNKNPLGLICGLICPDNFCMRVCVRRKIDKAINIPSIQATLIKKYDNQSKQQFANEMNGFKVAVLGSGPAGIGAAWQFLKRGFSVEIFESEEKVGGSLNLIPEERLSKEAIRYDYERLLQAEKITLHLNTMIRKPEALLEQGFTGVVIAVGTQNINNLGIEGEEHIVSYVDYLSHPEKYSNAKKVAVVGGGKVATDCALVAHKQKAEAVQILIRRNISDMRVSEAEREKLVADYTEIIPLTKVKKIEKRENKLICLLGKTQIVNEKCIDDPNFSQKEETYDLVIKAIGGSRIAIKENPQIICAGDCKNGATTVVEAVASGVEAAEKLYQYLKR